MEQGKISYAEFAAAEAKRAVNRLRDRWKKDPWLPGFTVDLRDHEAAFQTAVQHWAGPLEGIAPAVQDWLRWRFRRLQVDRKDDDRWVDLVRSELPRRVNLAARGPAQDRALGITPTDVSTAGATKWAVPETLRSTKRSRSDARSAVAKALDLPKATNRLRVDSKRVAEIVKASSAALLPLVPFCTDEDEQSSLVAALVSYVNQPGNDRARRRWLETVRTLKSR